MEDLVTYLTTAAANLPGIQGAIFLVAGLAGLVSVGLSLLHQVTAGRRGQGPLPATIAGLIFGSLLLSLSTVVNIFSVSIFGAVADPKIISSYTPVTGDNTRIAIQAIVAIVNVIGWVAAARGLWRWRVGPKYDQPGWFGSGLTFVLAGSIATNLYVFADVLAVSVGAIPIGTNYFSF
ncbi:hypothetical protein [Teredinibacter purpureus]|uniref:hypothetical protein n=1 Tax=Teredinibacter purpureus TaxID=2731756 RepID=UPI0005F791D6|nr:hypothetical protein [Teredinibacter purpureus]